MTAYNGAFNPGFAVSALGFGAIAERLGFRLAFLLAGSLTATGFQSRAPTPRSIGQVGQGKESVLASSSEAASEPTVWLLIIAPEQN
jgi:hypothetical protein